MNYKSFLLIITITLLSSIHIIYSQQLYTYDCKGRPKWILWKNGQVTPQYKGGIYSYDGVQIVNIHKTPDPNYFKQPLKQIGQIPTVRNNQLPDLFTKNKDNQYVHILTKNRDITQRYPRGVYIRSNQGNEFVVLKATI